MFSDFFYCIIFREWQMLNLHWIQFVRCVRNYAIPTTQTFTSHREYIILKTCIILSLIFTTDGMFSLVTFFDGCIGNSFFRHNNFKLYCIVLNGPEHAWNICHRTFCNLNQSIQIVIEKHCSHKQIFEAECAPCLFEIKLNQYHEN